MIGMSLQMILWNSHYKAGSTRTSTQAGKMNDAPIPVSEYFEPLYLLPQ